MSAKNRSAHLLELVRELPERNANGLFALEFRTRRLVLRRHRDGYPALGRPALATDVDALAQGDRVQPADRVFEGVQLVPVLVQLPPHVLEHVLGIDRPDPAPRAVVKPTTVPRDEGGERLVRTRSTGTVLGPIPLRPLRVRNAHRAQQLFEELPHRPLASRLPLLRTRGTACGNKM
jgi:hypothetical protein